MFRDARLRSGPFRHGSLPAPRWKRDARRSLRIVAAEGATDKSVHAISDSFTIPLALALGATSALIGVLAAFPRLAAAVAQVFAPTAIGRLRSYRRVLYLSSLASGLAFAGIAIVPWLPDGMRIPVLIVLVAAGTALLEFASPALGCWVSEQVPVTRRGRYVASRHALSALATVLVLLLGGPFLDAMAGRVLLGLAACFGVASALRLFSAALFFHIKERAVQVDHLVRPTPRLFLSTLRRTQLGRFLIYSFIMHFGAFFATPFFAPYQLEVLGFSYSGLLIPTVVMTICGLVGVQLAGRMADRFGNMVVLRTAALAMPIVPIAWVWITTPTHVAIANILSGVVWATFHLCSMNFVYEISREEDRANNVAFFSFTTGVALFLGAVTGALVFNHLPELAGSRYLMIFVLSGMIRLLPALLVLPFVSEVRRCVDPPKPVAEREATAVA